MARVQLVAVWLVGLATLQLVSTAPTSTLDREALAPVFGKKFWMDHCDNMVEGLQAFGVNETTSRNFVRDFTFTVMLNEDNGEYTLSTSMYMKGKHPTHLLTLRVPFRIGQETEITKYNDEAVKTVFTQDGNTLTETRGGKYAGTSVTTFTPEQVKVTDKFKGIINNCVYKPE